jgi:hypothetical protein
MDAVKPALFKDESRRTVLIELEKIAEETAKKIHPIDRSEQEKAEICIKIGIYEAVNKIFV